jgi:hypothetical protein
VITQDDGTASIPYRVKCEQNNNESWCVAGS